MPRAQASSSSIWTSEKKAFFAGEPDQDIDIARRADISPSIRAKDRDPFGIVFW
jgi:hypothetical protein